MTREAVEFELELDCTVDAVFTLIMGFFISILSGPSMVTQDFDKFPRILK